MEHVFKVVGFRYALGNAAAQNLEIGFNTESSDPLTLVIPWGVASPMVLKIQAELRPIDDPVQEGQILRLRQVGNFRAKDGSTGLTLKTQNLTLHLALSDEDRQHLVSLLQQALPEDQSQRHLN